MNEDEHRQRSCSAKTLRFGTRFDAWQACLSIYVRERDVLHAYWCKFCQRYHIGHPISGRSRQRTAKTLEKMRRKTLWKPRYVRGE